LERELAVNQIYEYISSPSVLAEQMYDSPDLLDFAWMLRMGLVNRRRTFRRMTTVCDEAVAAGGYDLDERDRLLCSSRNLLFYSLSGNGLLRGLVPWSLKTQATLTSTQFALLEMQCRDVAGGQVLLLPDPFAPGQPLRERDGVFYSVGPNGRDEGGKPRASGHFYDLDAPGDVSLLSWYKPPRGLTGTHGSGKIYP
jgi:hypothetical protein